MENGRKALDLIRKQFFPIVLTDWQMPEMEGPELCRAIREENPDRYVFIIMLTSKGSKDDIISGLDAGADDYLTKPAHYAELVARIKSGIRILELEKSLKAAVDEIHLLSITDPLTGIYNRGYINERLPQEIRRANRYGRDLSIILCDIDHFKKINDTYGHLSGDAVLKDFSRCIQTVIRRQIDWAGRYGGEEFLIVLPETGQTGAMVLAERLRAAVSVSVTRADGCDVSVTASFGVTGILLSPDGQKTVTPELLLRQADILLYEAKAAGRNQVRGAPVDALSRFACPACPPQYPLFPALFFSRLFSQPPRQMTFKQGVPDGLQKRSRDWRIIGAELD